MPDITGRTMQRRSYLQYSSGLLAIYIHSYCGSQPLCSMKVLVDLLIQLRLVVCIVDYYLLSAYQSMHTLTLLILLCTQSTHTTTGVCTSLYEFYSVCHMHTLYSQLYASQYSYLVVLYSQPLCEVCLANMHTEVSILMCVQCNRRLCHPTKYASRTRVRVVVCILPLEYILIIYI